MKKLTLLCIFLFSTSYSYSQEAKSLQNVLKSEETFEEKEQKIIDYSNIQDVLKKDGLTKQRIKREKLVKQIAIERKEIAKGKYDYPREEDFWTFMSELWLVKNAQLVSWDFPKPDYGIKEHFQSVLEKLGFFNKRFKILIVNTPTIVHFGLPADKNEYIFLLSLPFIRTLDLTKEDISMILLEDFFRLESGDFVKNLEADTSFLGTNFFGKQIAKEKIQKIMNSYTNLVFKKGFNFQQQYDVTKKMDSILRSNPGLWQNYFKLLMKINRTVKSDVLYKDYLKIYPSPDLQIQWLSPKKPVL